MHLTSSLYISSTYGTHGNNINNIANGVLRDVVTSFTKVFTLMMLHGFTVGQDSVVSIATCYELDGQGIETQWGRDFQHLSRPALGPTQQPPVQWVPGHSRG